MLEGPVANLLNRFLGVYIRNFDPKQLNIGIWSGDVKLKNLELRREALDQLRLPINVIEGHLGQLTLSIPWANLKGRPVKVFIEDVFLLAAPKEYAEYNEEEEEKRAQAVKMEKLDSAEMLKERNVEGLSQEEKQKNQSFTDSLVTKIVDNLQVTVRNIHIRYEDSISAPGHPFALGFTLEEFSAVSTTEDWNPSYIQTSAGVTHKLATLGALAVYWNTDSPLLGAVKGSQQEKDDVAMNHEEIFKKFREMIVKGETPELGGHQFVLKPVSGLAKIILDKTGKTDRPKLKAKLQFNEIGFVLDDDQYRDALMMVDLFHYFIRHQIYKKYEPKGVTPKEDPRAWFRFAGNAVLSKIHDRNRLWSWDHFKERRDNRIRYIELYKLRKMDQPLPPSDSAELEKLEKKISYEDLRFWRSLARNQLRKEKATVKKSAAPTQKQGWIAWAWGAPKEEQKAEESTVLSDQQRKELYDAIDWNEKNALAEAVDAPKDSVKLQVEASLDTGSFTLKREPHGKNTEILSTSFDTFKANFYQRPDSFLADISLGGLRMYDGTTEGNLFKQFARVKDSPPILSDSRIRELDGDEQPVPADRESVKDAAADPFFQLQFEQRPLDESADSAITIKLKSMEIIYNPNLIVEIARFFKPPERHLESIGALMESASATVEGIRKQTRAGLEFALEEHKTINAKLDLQAPLIIIPDNVTSENANCLILDAGHVSLSSELVEKTTMKEIQAKQKKQYSEQDYTQLEGLMYDKFLLKLEATQVLIGPSIERVKKQLQNKDDTKRFHIVERINIDFVVEVSIIPKAPNITKFRISGHLPVLNASVSDMKYKTLMKLIDVAIPKFGDNSQLDTKSHAQHTKEDSKTQQPAIKPRASQRASFKFSPSQRQIISEDDDTDNESNRSIHRSKELSSDEEMSLHQRSFQLKFTVDKLQGSLSKVDPEGKKPDQLLVELVAEHFQLDFYIRPYDMVAEVLLKALNVDDHIEENPTPEFKKIVSSVGFDADASKDLFFVKYMKVNRMSPEFMDIHESIDTHIDVSISTINTIVTRRTLLTLLDFVLLTFTNQNPPTQAPKAVAASESNENSAENGLNTPAGDTNPSTDRMRVKIDLSSIVLILNNDGIRLATLSLNTANLNIFLMGKTMKIGGRLGNLSLVDEINQGASLHSPLRQLVTIQGHELADFKYETFDSNLANSYPGYSSSVYLRSGSIKVNFLEEPFRKIIEFLDKFGKMQAIFNAARQAAMNQANQIQENADKMHFDVLVKTPILVFPRVMTAGKGGRDTVTAYLGEIYANNKFVSLEDDPEVSGTINKLSAGIRNIRLTSDFFYGDGESEELEMINKVDLAFNISYLEHKIGAKRPDLEFHGSMSDIKLRISQDQLRFLLELSRSVPAAFASDPVESQRLVLEELPDITTKPAKAIATNSPNEESSPIISLGPELQSTPDTWAKLDMVFRMPSVGLELLLADGDNPIRDTEAASLSKFSLNDTKIKLRMMSDGSIASEILVNSFTIRDSRKTETNKFRKIMSSMDNNVQQFMASITISGGTERNLIAILTIDSPRIIFALDYIFALHSFINLGMTVAEPIADKIDLKESSDQLDDYHSSDSTELDTQNFHYQDNTGKKESSGTQQSAMDISFRGNIVNAQVILIANPTASHSEAIVLGTKQVMLSQQNALMLQVTKIGMFLCRMDKFETSRLRILDDFNLKMSMETKSPGSQSSLTSINIDIDPLVLRLSLRDILLALQIINKASELSGSEDSSSKEIESKKTKELKSSSLKVRSASGKGLSTKPSKTSRTINSAKSAITRMNKSNPGDLIVMKKEELTARLEGIRIILIGDLHELPLLDLSVKNFDVGVKDWTGSISGDTNIDLFVNVYNFSKSTWEPLIEPWQMGFHLARDQNPSRLSVDIYSRKMLEITATSATIALASNSAQFLSQDEDVLSKPRIADAPYRIINYTGFDLKVWTNGSDTKEAVTAKLADGEEVPWRFEESEKMREHLSPEGSAGVISAHLEDSDFDPISAISVNREGERLYILRPKRNGVLHRILVEVKLESDNVKYITLRSPLLVENHTLIPVEIGVYSPDEDNLLRIIKCPPGESRPSPIGAAFIHSLVIRPDQGFGYTWSDAPLHWKDVMKRPVRTITCKGENGERTPPFYFQMKALYNENSPLSR
ncbi:MAG: hypothetical protein M1829_003289 [Trizodia sp. TS-e1964]|nr:MAG: hypothetical protein M1829_003289 [Trizodia sp. TS-e1964]